MRWCDRGTSWLHRLRRGCSSAPRRRRPRTAARSESLAGLSLASGALRQLALGTPQTLRSGGEGSDHVRVELPAALPQDLVDGLLPLAPFAVGTVGGHRVEGVGDREDARDGRDSLPAQAVRIALPVPTLVV